MTQSFDERFDTTTYRGYVDENDMESAWDAGAQSKQAEIDEYKEVASSMEDSYLREKAKVDELRKRIDVIVKSLENIKNDQLRSYREDYDKGWRDCAITVLNDLKGTTNEQ